MMGGSRHGANPLATGKNKLAAPAAAIVRLSFDSSGSYLGVVDSNGDAAVFELRYHHAVSEGGGGTDLAVLASAKAAATAPSDPQEGGALASLWSWSGGEGALKSPLSAVSSCTRYDPATVRSPPGLDPGRIGGRQRRGGRWGQYLSAPPGGGCPRRLPPCTVAVLLLSGHTLLPHVPGRRTFVPEAARQDGGPGVRGQEGHSDEAGDITQDPEGHIDLPGSNDSK